MRLRPNQSHLYNTEKDPFRDHNKARTSGHRKRLDKGIKRNRDHPLARAGAFAFEHHAGAVYPAFGIVGELWRHGRAQGRSLRGKAVLDRPSQ